MKLQRLLGAIGAVILSASIAGAAEQASYVTPGAGPMSMAAFVTTYLNPALRALAACNNGASAPANGPGAAPMAFQLWCDTTANPMVVKRYDGASWVAIGALNTTTHAWSPYLTGGTSGGVPYFSSAGVMGSSGVLAQYGFVVGGGAGGAPSSIAPCTDDQVAFGQTGNSPLCRTVTGDISFAAGVSAIGANKVTNAMLRQSGALALVGRAANSTGNVADIQATAASDCVYREASSTIGCGQVATAGLANNAVSNAKLATMAANTTKCNATAGTAVPTDCTGATMRTNLGLVIGTNVEAWDADLDCIAALASTGLIKRTGVGTCSAGAVALADLAAGTQDTLIGYFGSTTASAAAIGNCSNALTYSTTSHAFGCNTTAGTGTVTQVICGTGLTGGTITASGTCAVDYATKAEQQTGSSTSKSVNPARQQDHDSAAKVWASWVGSSCALNASYNVASCTRNSAGDYTIAFSTAFASTNYACMITTTFTSIATDGGFQRIKSSSKATASVAVQNFNNAGTGVDPVEMSLVCYGRQ